MKSIDQSESVLLLHDGEFSDLLAALKSLGPAFVERRGPLLPCDLETPWEIVIASSKRITELDANGAEIPGTRIAVVDGDSRTLRAMMQRTSIELLVRRPVHPAALRLLVMHVLYHGPEKRRASRVSIGGSVRFRVGLRRRSAVLVEVSMSGCRILAHSNTHRLRTDRLLSLQIPAKLSAGRGFSLAARVARVSPADADMDTIALVFEKMKSKTKQHLQAFVATHGEGPAIMDDAALAAGAQQPSAHGAPESEGTSAGDSVDERRGKPRHVLWQRVIALSDEAARVLIGRDLSAGGMRVEATSDFGIGDKLRIALHAGAGDLPLVVSAQVVRDDGESGLVLQFVDLSEDSAQHIETILQSFPPIEDSGAGSDSPGIFVSELLERQTG